MSVTGIGGVFFRAKDPKALHAWYRTHLGVTTGDWSPWMQAAGPTVFMPFPADTDYFSADKGWMMNFRVSDLDGLMADLRAAGIEAVTKAGIEAVTKAEWDTPETGRFARIHDPEGNPIELWERPVE